MDLTCLNLRHFDRVPEVLLIRHEWDAVIDLFNKRPSGKRGSAVWTGQPGIGKRHYGPSISGLQLIILLNEGKTALFYYILVICLIQAQSIIFQDTTGAVYAINDKVHKQMGDTVGLPGDQVLVLIDGDGKHCQPDPRILPARNVRIPLTSFPGVEVLGAGSFKTSKIRMPRMLSDRGSGTSLQSHRL